MKSHTRPVSRSALGLAAALAALLVPAILPAGAPGAAAPVAAQETPPSEPGIPPAEKGSEKRKDGEKGSGGRIRMGDAPDDRDDPPPAPPAEGGGAEAEPQKTETDLWIDALSTWPSLEAKQASIRLSTQPALSAPRLLEELGRPAEDWRRVCGVAATLGKIGDQRALDLIRTRLRDRALFTHGADLLDAIVRIDPVGAKPRLLAELLHPASTVVAEVEARLAPRVGPTDVDALRDVLEAGDTAARTAAVTLLVKADPAASRATVANALRDKSPEVAWTAARSLAADDAPEAEEILRRATLAPVDRQVAYACLALGLRGERTGRRTIDDATLRLLLGGRGLAGVDPMCRAAAAVVLADLGYFHEVASLDDVLDRQIVPALIQVVAADSYWPDLKVFQPLAARRLQRLTGRSSGESPKEWIAWWQQSAHSFRAQRILLEIPEEQFAAFSLHLSGSRAPGGEGTTLAASPEGLTWAAPDAFAILLGPEEARDLALRVNASGMLRAAEQGVVVEGASPLEAVVRAGRRERRVPLGDAAPGEGTRAVIEAVEGLRRSHSWQRYRVTSQSTDLPAFVAAMGERFSADRSDAQRAAALADLITAALDDARGEAWNLRALEELRSLPGLGDALGDDGTRRLLSRLGRRETVDPTAEALVTTLAAASRSEAHPLLLDFLTTRTSPRCEALLVEVFRHAREADLASGLASEVPALRSAALASLDESSPREAADAAVRKALEHEDVGIRREAVRALGRLRAEWARKDIEELAGRPGDLRGAAVEALGRLGGRSALPVLMSAFAADDPGLRVTAVEALGATREPEALSALAFAMSMDPAGVVREVASRVLVSIGTERAAAALRRLALDRAQAAGPRTRALGGLVLLAGRDSLRDVASLLDDPAVEVADEAALSLAVWRDEACVPRLLEMLEKGRRRGPARTALEGISLESFPQEDADLVARLYSGWWETSKERGRRGWLVDALVLGGIDDPALRAWETGAGGVEAAPFLIRGLRTGTWAVRRACDLALREMSQRSYGDVGQFTTSVEAGRIAAGWELWWDEQSAAEGEPR